MKIITKAATLSGFTLVQLGKLADTAVGVPVRIEFDMLEPIGEITGAHVMKDALYVEVSLNDDFLVEFGRYVIPGYMSPEYRCFAFGMTYSPEDGTLCPITPADIKCY